MDNGNSKTTDKVGVAVAILALIVAIWSARSASDANRLAGDANELASTANRLVEIANGHAEKSAASSVNSAEHARRANEISEKVLRLDEVLNEPDVQIVLALQDFTVDQSNPSGSLSLIVENMGGGTLFQCWVFAEGNEDSRGSATDVFQRGNDKHYVRPLRSGDSARVRLKRGGICQKCNSSKIFTIYVRYFNPVSESNEYKAIVFRLGRHGQKIDGVEYRNVPKEKENGSEVENCSEDKENEPDLVYAVVEKRPS